MSNPFDYKERQGVSCGHFWHGNAWSRCPRCGDVNTEEPAVEAAPTLSTSAQSERCQRCGTESPDLRTLLLTCLYKLEETGMPFVVYDHIANDGRKFYALRICKECRGLFIRSLMEWFGQESWANGIKLTRQQGRP